MKLFLLLFLVSFSFFNTKNPYKVLGLPCWSTFKEIKDRYKDLAKKYHPDKHAGSPNYDKIKVQFRDINQAYETLKEKRKIGEHDEDDNHLFTLILESIAVIILLFVYAYIQNWFLRTLVWILESVTGFGVIFTSVFHVVDKFFDHHIEEEENKIIIIFVISIAIAVYKRYFYSSKKIEDKRKD